MATHTHNTPPGVNGSPLLSAIPRRRVEAAIDSLIAYLDATESDPDLEEAGDLEPSTDRELDTADDEPSLGSLGSTAMAVDGQHWSDGSGDDFEEDVPTGIRRARLSLSAERDAMDAANRDLRRLLDRLTGRPVADPFGLRVAS